MEDYRNVNLETGLSEDVETFVRAHVARERLYRWKESIRKKILRKLFI